MVNFLFRNLYDQIAIIKRAIWHHSEEPFSADVIFTRLQYCMALGRENVSCGDQEICLRRSSILNVRITRKLSPQTQDSSISGRLFIQFLLVGFLAVFETKSIKGGLVSFVINYDNRLISKRFLYRLA